MIMSTNSSLFLQERCAIIGEGETAPGSTVDLPMECTKQTVNLQAQVKTPQGFNPVKMEIIVNGSKGLTVATSMSGLVSRDHGFQKTKFRGIRAARDIELTREIKLAKGGQARQGGQVAVLPANLMDGVTESPIAHTFTHFRIFHSNQPKKEEKQKIHKI